MQWQSRKLEVEVHQRANATLRVARTFLRQRRIDLALDALRKAERLGASPDECAASRWECFMFQGDFAGAWRESDRIAARGASGPGAFWDGGVLDGKRVIIRCLHGYGDAIQNLRYAAIVRQRAARVIVETHPEMVSLVRCIAGIDEVVTWAGGSTLPRSAWDRQIEVTELPWALRTEIDSIPGDFPYVSIDGRRREASLRLLGRSGKPRIGLVWASSMWNPARCIPLKLLAPILDADRFDFYSFQRGPQREELSGMPKRISIHDTATHSAEIIDTAADLTHMDLLISVDTMAAHLGGALGIPVWLLLPFEADWRWMLEREDTPWYPSLRLFRQQKQGDWTSVIGSLRNEL